MPGDIKHLGFNFDGHLLALGLLWISAGSRHHVSRFGDLRGTRWNETQRIQNQGFDDARTTTLNLTTPAILQLEVLNPTTTQK